MNRSKIANLVRSHYPKTFGFRKKMQRERIRRIKSRFLPGDVVAACEKDPSQKKTVVEQYLVTWKSYLVPYVQEMEELMEKSPAFREYPDPDALRTDIMFCKMAYGFLPSEYSGFGFVDKTTEERKAYISDLERFIFCYTVDDICALQDYMDKGKEYELLAKYYQRDAVAVEKPKDYAIFCAFIEKHPVFVRKNVYLSMGNSVELVDSNGKDKEALFRSLISSGKVLLEERVIQHPHMAALNQSSVNTVRCMTMITKTDVIIPFCFLKAGRHGTFVDNAGAGGIVVGIDPADGTCKTDGFTEYGERYLRHPETDITFRGFQLPEWGAMTALCKKMAAEHPEVPYIGWDLAYTEHGWVVIEANGLGQFIIPQIVWQRGIKTDIQSILEKMEYAV